MAVSVTKGSGRYFSDYERVWTETRDTGVQPFWVGRLPSWLNLPAQPNPDLLRSLADGRPYLKHVQANRVGCYDLTISFGKSISLLAYGLTPPNEWKGWTETFARVATPAVEQLVNNQQINFGPQGRYKVPSHGVAAAFPHWKGYWSQPHAHIHYCIENVSTDGLKTVGSIANVREGLFEKQGVGNARVQKSLDDELQAKGFETVRVGKKVELAKVPKELLDELSPARQAMNRAREEKGFSGPRAMDFYARAARREAGPRVDRTPDEVHRDTTELAKKYGVTLDSLKRDPKSPSQPRGPATEMTTAYHVAQKAVRSCSKKHGRFTEDQFFERLYTLAIGKPTTVAALDEMGKEVLQDRSIAGVRQHREVDGTARYYTPRSAKVERAAAQPYRSDTKEAWEDLKRATKGLGSAVLVASARKATQIVDQLSEMVSPAPRKVVIDASQLAEVIDQLRPTNYFKAHAKALFAGFVKGSGNPHDRAAIAEKVFEGLRSHDRLRKNTVLIVDRASLASARELHLLGKIAKRDKATVFLAERDAAGLEKLLNRKHNGLNRGHSHEL
jgi:conjugative relaxase-like TrwC/TraI family protein